MIELVNKERPEGIWVGDMKDGEIGIIVQWDGIDSYKGEIVQRYKQCLLVVGSCSGQGWGEIFPVDSHNINENCRVRLLEKGEMLIIT